VKAAKIKAKAMSARANMIKVPPYGRPCPDFKPSNLGKIEIY